MAKGNGGLMSGSAYNETGTKDTPEQMDPYFSQKDVSHHGQSENFKDSVNSKSGEGIMGHEAKRDGAKYKK